MQLHLNRSIYIYKLTLAFLEVAGYCRTFHKQSRQQPSRHSSFGMSRDFPFCRFLISFRISMSSSCLYSDARQHSLTYFLSISQNSNSFRIVAPQKLDGKCSSPDRYKSNILLKISGFLSKKNLVGQFCRVISFLRELSLVSCIFDKVWNVVRNMFPPTLSSMSAIFLI